MRAGIVIVDDHRVVRNGMRLLLDEDPAFEVVGEAGDAEGALRLAREIHPDVLLLDVSMPGRPGRDVIRDVAEASPETRVVVLTMHADQAFAARMLAAGATGFVLKERADRELRTAVELAVAGQTYVTPELAGDPDASTVLSPQEREVLRAVALDQPNTQIARALGTTVRTVETHRASIARKLGSTTHAAFVQAATELHLLS